MNAQPFRVAMRADASRKIGLGHVKRCLSLARALMDVGAEVRLISRDLGVDVRSMARAEGVSVELLRPPGEESIAASDNVHAHWAEVSWQQDVKDTVAAVTAGRSDWVIVDHYAFDASWHRSISQQLGASIAVIDDLADRPLAAQLVIDQNYAANHRLKYASCVAADVKILGGPRFALLAPVYATVGQYQFSEAVRSIGIFMGGVDAPDWSGVVVRACREEARFAGRIEIATTRANPNLESLRLLSERWPGTAVLMDLPDLSGFFARHDVQIGAGGGATWERCRVGAPTLALACADNQRAVVAELEAVGAVATLERSDELSVETIGRAVRRIIDDPAARARIAERARALVDGLGATRVALCMAASRMQLRPARREDASLIYQWRNHALTREMSVNSGEIEWPAHQRWFDAVLVDAARILQIGTIGAVPVGVIRFDGIGGAEAEVSLYLNPELHGLGLGRLLLESGEHHVRQRVPGLRRIVATVLDRNVVSRRMFQAAGYTRRDDGYLVKQLDF